MQDNSNPNARRVPISQGWRWLCLAIKAVREEALLLTIFVVAYIFLMAFLTAIPFAGLVLSAVVMPFGTIFIAHATRNSLQRKPLNLSLLSAAVKSPHARTLFMLGMAYGFMLITMQTLYWLLSSPVTALWQTTQNDRLVWSSVLNNIPWLALTVTMVLYVPTMMATWFAPMLIHEKGMTLGKSLFYSFFGCLKNLLPIFLLGICLFLGVTLTIAGVASVMDQFHLQEIESMVLIPVTMLLCAAVYASYWPMYDTLFEGVRNEETLR